MQYIKESKQQWDISEITFHHQRSDCKCFTEPEEKNQKNPHTDKACSRLLQRLGNAQPTCGHLHQLQKYLKGEIKQLGLVLRTSEARNH